MRLSIGSVSLAFGILTCSYVPGTLARAQSVTATLVGTVFDSSNAVVPRPKISLA